MYIILLIQIFMSVGALVGAITLFKENKVATTLYGGLFVLGALYALHTFQLIIKMSSF